MKQLPLLALVFMVFFVSSAQAAEIILTAPGGIRAALEEMIPAFEKKTGNSVKATFGSGLGTKAQVLKADPAFDVAVLQPPYPDVLASGRVVNASEVALAHVAVGIAVRKGMTHPDIATPQAVKAMFLSVSSFAYPDPQGGAAAGVSVERTLKLLGIAQAVKPKIVLAQGGAGAMAMVAEGKVDIGLTFISEIMPVPGVEVVGAIPEAISPPTRLVAFLGKQAQDPDAAKAFIAYISSPEAAGIYRAHGMVPGR